MPSPYDHNLYMQVVPHFLWWFILTVIHKFYVTYYECISYEIDNVTIY